MAGSFFLSLKFFVKDIKFSAPEQRSAEKALLSLSSIPILYIYIQIIKAPRYELI